MLTIKPLGITLKSQNKNYRTLTRKTIVAKGVGEEERCIKIFEAAFSGHVSGWTPVRGGWLWVPAFLFPTWGNSQEIGPSRGEGQAPRN